MPIIYTYPTISDLQLDDSVLVTDKSNNNNTNKASISQILDLAPPVVDSLNGFTGNVNIIAGSNISVDNITGQNNIEISTTSNTISSGNNGEFAFFSGTGSTLEGSPLLTTSSNRVYLQDYIYHKDNVGANEARFGFNDDNKFLVYLDSGAQERLTLSDDSFAVWTGLTRKISAGSTNAGLYHELESVAPTKSQITLTTTERGVRVATTYRSDTPGSEFDFGGQIQFAASQDAGKYVGLMGPISSELTANYNLMLPNTPPTSGQLLAVGATAQGTPPNMYRKLEWIDGGSAVGVTQLTAGSGISLTPSSGIGIVEVSSTSISNPGGADTEMQYNNGGSFGGTTGLEWDNTNNILSIETRFEGDIDGAVLQQVIAAEALSKGDVVYISGGTGDNPEVSKAQANSPSTMAALGIMKDNTNVNDIGECVTSGEITGLNLTGFTTGDELFVSNTTAGELLTSAPTGEANLIQKIGKVVKGGNGGALTVLGAFRINATPNLNKGNIFVGNTVNQSSVLSVGTDNYVLTANSAAPQGVEWKVSQNTNVANSNLVFDNSYFTEIGDDNTWTIVAKTGGIVPGKLNIEVAGGVDIGSAKPLEGPTSLSMIKGTFNKLQNNWTVNASSTNPEGGTGWPTPPSKQKLDLRNANNNYFNMFQSVDLELFGAVIGASYKFIAFYNEPTLKLNLFYKDGIVIWPDSASGNVGGGSQIESSANYPTYDVYDLYCVKESDPDNGILGVMLATQSLNHKP